MSTRRKKAPPLSRLLDHYIKLGCPVREGWLCEIYASQRRSGWIVLYGAPNSNGCLESDPNPELAPLLERGVKTLGAVIQLHEYSILDLVIFEFCDREAAIQFEREVLCSLKPLVGLTDQEATERTFILNGCRQRAMKTERGPIEINQTAFDFFEFKGE